MKLTEFLTPENIHTGVILSSKKRALEVVGKYVAQAVNQQHPCENGADEVCEIACFGNLFKRERLGSTSLNNGIALPHAKLPDNTPVQLVKPVAVFLQLEQPIDYESADHKAVDLIYAVMFPEQCCPQYKGKLAELAEKVSDKALLKQLRLAQSAEEIWQVLSLFDRQNDTPEKQEIV